MRIEMKWRHHRVLSRTTSG